MDGIQPRMGADEHGLLRQRAASPKSSGDIRRARVRGGRRLQGSIESVLADLFEATDDFPGRKRGLGRFDPGAELVEKLAGLAQAFERAELAGLDGGLDLADARRSAEQVPAEEQQQDEARQA